jgi:hypothetical protein
VAAKIKRPRRRTARHGPVLNLRSTRRCRGPRTSTTAELAPRPTPAPQSSPWDKQTVAGQNIITNAANANSGGKGISGQYQGIINSGGYNDAQKNALGNTRALANSSWSVSPELQKIIDQTNTDANTNVSLANSASGRYGSGMGNGAIADAVSKNTNNLLYSDLSNFQTRKDAANSNLFNMDRPASAISARLYGPAGAGTELDAGRGDERGSGHPQSERQAPYFRPRSRTSRGRICLVSTRSHRVRVSSAGRLRSLPPVKTLPHCTWIWRDGRRSSRSFF